MGPEARLQRLRELQSRDLNALPDRPPPPSPDPESVFTSDDDLSGGVSLQEHSCSHQDLVPPTLAPTVVHSSAAPAPKDNLERRFVLVQGIESSYNLGSTPKLSALPNTATKLPPTELKKGEIAPQTYFTPIIALSRYPYKYCNKDCMQQIASAIFDAGKFWAREWDLYYVWDIHELKPLILVGESQVESLLEEINSTLQLSLRITSQQREEGLVSRFPDHPRCLPRYLGRSFSKHEYDTLVANVPGVMSRIPAEPVPSPMDGRTLEDFKEMMEELWEIQKAKSKAVKEKKKVERLAKQKVFADHFKRAQRYLGLRPSQNGPTMAGQWASVDTSTTAPYPFDRSVVFVCVDVESYERAHHKITEVGVATLDTRDLIGVAPGDNGENWRAKIQARHFRIKDNAHLVNSEFVTGCPDRFDFGNSDWVSLRDAPAAVAECFKPPFCARQGNLSLNEQRNLIFLGHDTLGDVKYLQQLGFDPLTLPNLLEAQDTATMYRVWRREQQPTNLGSILYDFDIAGFNLHNAGNDAVFTVQAMLGVCIREASIRGSSDLKVMREEEKSAKVAAAQEEAKKFAEEKTDGWSDQEVDGDGGAPVPIAIRTTAQPVQRNSPIASSQSNGGGRGLGRGRGTPEQRAYSNGYTHGGDRHTGYSRSSGRTRGGGGHGRTHGASYSATQSRPNE